MRPGRRLRVGHMGQTPAIHGQVAGALARLGRKRAGPPEQLATSTDLFRGMENAEARGGLDSPEVPYVMLSRVQ